MASFAFFAWLCVGALLTADAGIVRVMLIHNSNQNTAGWKKGFLEFFVPYLNSQYGGFNISGDPASPYAMEAVLCEQDLSSDAESKLQACVTAASNGQDLQGNAVGDIDAILVGSSSGNKVVQEAAETAKIPNLHCSGGNPAMWTAATPHAFGMHLPFPWYSRGPIRQASLQGVKSIMVIRDHDWGFPRISAVAAMEWSLEANMKVIGPTLAWCRKWAAKATATCREVTIAGSSEPVCRCGLQSEWDALGYKYQADTMPSFYEISESKVAEAGFSVRGEYISPAIVEYVRDIIRDVRSQGGDPDMIVNWMAAGRSGLMAAVMEKLSYKTYFGGPNAPGTKWNGYESYFQNGTEALRVEHALYNVGGGQWHHEMGFSDPIFGSSQKAREIYKSQMGEEPTYDGAACMAAGIAVAFGLQKYGTPLDVSSVSARRQEIRLAVGNLNDETLFGMVRFNRFNQNNGRMSVNWQVLEDGGTRPVLPPEAAATPFRFPSPSWGARLGCLHGTFASGPSTLTVPLQCVPCEEGTYRPNGSSMLEFSTCQQCPAGSGTLPGQQGLTACGSCPAGRAQNGLTDKGVCNLCPLGTSRLEGSGDGTSCQLCEAGRYAAETGLASCKACPAFSSQPDRGQTSCICDVGAYKDPADLSSVGVTTACLPCDAVLPGSTTLYPGSKRKDICVCPVGSFWWRASADASEAKCKLCGDGLKCLGGFAQEPGGNLSNILRKHQPPMQAAGFSAGSQSYDGGDPSWIVRCDNTMRCSEGLTLGSCAGLNAGLSCSDCKEAAYDDGSSCAECGDIGASIGPLLVAIVLAIIAMIGIFFIAMKPSSPYRDTLATITITGGLCASTLQTIAAFNKISVPWIEPFNSLKGILGLLSFNIGIIRPACFLGEMSPVGSYTASLFLYPICVATLSLAFVFAKFLAKRHVTINQVINAQGMVLTAIYIALTFLAALPYQCEGNPDGTSSLLAYRGVICWGSEQHTQMLVLSVPLFLVIISFMAMVMWITMVYPYKVAQPGGVEQVKRFNFLFQRFATDSYYFALIMNTRNLSIGLIPVIMVGITELQFVTLAMVIGSYTILQAKLWPWRTQDGNLLDTFLNLMLIVFLVIGSMLVGFEEGRGQVVMQVLMTIVMVIVPLSLLIVGAFALYRSLRPRRTFGIFLSHHKIAAAVLSRWFKMILSEQTTSRIFLDSDDVNKLDAIIDTTAYDCDNVVVLLTSQTLERMWCAAEIASAWRAGTNLVFVSCDGCRFSPELIESLPNLWTEEQQATLQSSGVTLPDITAAYQALAKMPVINLAREGAKLEDHQAAAEQVLAQCKNLGLSLRGSLTKNISSTKSKGSLISGMYMIGDVLTPEPGCCCRVIQSMLQRKMQEPIVLLEPSELQSLPQLSEKFWSAKVVLVVLTQGMLQVPTFAAMLAACPEPVRANTVPIKADDNFIYPSPAFWQDLAAGKILSKAILAELGTSVEDVGAAYGKLFNVLALKFTSHGSEQIQSTEIEVMAGRLLDMLKRPAVQRVDKEQPEQVVPTGELSAVEQQPELANEEPVPTRENPVQEKPKQVEEELLAFNF